MTCSMWWDKNIPRASVLERASEVAGQPVDDAMVKRWCGMARRKPTDDPEETPR